MKESSLQYIFDKRQEYKWNLLIRSFIVYLIFIIVMWILFGITISIIITYGILIILFYLNYKIRNIIHRKAINRKRRVSIETYFPVKDLVTPDQRELILLDMDFFFNGLRESRENGLHQNKPMKDIMEIATISSKVKDKKKLNSTEIDALNRIYSLDSFKVLGR